jgi:hypothetical protein
MLIHVVLFTYCPGIRESTRRRAFKLHEALGKVCGGQKAGILFWKIDLNADLRKNVEIVQFSIFKDAEALQRFRRHPKHDEFTDIMSEISDWQVGDIYLNSSDVPSLIKTFADFI